MNRSVGGQSRKPDESRKHETCKRAQALRLPRVRPQMRADEQHRVVLQIASDAGQVGAHIDAERAQIIGRADPGAHQHRGRLERAGAENDLPRAEFAMLRRRRSPRRRSRVCPSNSSFETAAPVAIVRFGRARTAASR